MKQIDAAQQLEQELPRHLKRAMELGSEKGASSWLIALPIEELGFALHKGDFRDALCLRYGWKPSNFPSKCACGASFSVDHALCCSKGGFPTHRHNEIRDFTASVLTEVCHDVCTEPPLQELAGEPLPYATSNREDGARLDIRAQGFWGDRFRRAFFDIRVFYPNASSYHNLQLSSIYRRHEKEKKRHYEDRVREVEHGSFTPLVFSTSGGMGGLATTTYKRLASQIAIYQEGPALQQGNFMATLPSLFLALAVLNHGYQRSTILCRTRYHVYTSSGPGSTCGMCSQHLINIHITIYLFINYYNCW